MQAVKFDEMLFRKNNVILLNSDEKEANVERKNRSCV